MSWAKFDDRYHDNRKIKRAWRRHPRAVGLHAMAVTYCAMHETDGVVDAEWLEDKLPSRAERAKVLATLVDVGLFEALAAGDYVIHDYLSYNRSREAAEAERQKAAERQSRFRERNRNGVTNGVVARESHDPDPTRPDPTDEVRDAASEIDALEAPLQDQPQGSTGR